MKLRLFLIILGGHYNERSDKIIDNNNKNDFYNYSLTKEFIKSNKKSEFKAFDFMSQHKRRLEEYDDLKIYICNQQNFVITNDGDKDFIKDINFGLIDRRKLNIDQRTSMNVWLCLLDQNLKHISNDKLDMSYFENQNYSIWMDLNHKFLINTRNFKNYQSLNYPHINKDVMKAMEEIVNEASQNKKEIRGDVTIYFIISLIILIA